MRWLVCNCVHADLFCVGYTMSPCPARPRLLYYHYWLIYLQDRDFEPLHEGSPLFESINGEIVTYDGSLGPTVTPIFINEAAYYYAASGLGIMITEAVEWPVPAA